MPVIEVHLIEGYSSEAKSRLAQALTDASRLVVPAPADAITVMFHEKAGENYYRGRTQRVPAAELPDPEQRVSDFLDKLGQRDLSGAQALLSDNATLHFPGAKPMNNLNQVIEWSSSRYRSVAKTIERVESFGAASGMSVVIVSGSLAGVWPNGKPFQNIRFIDRFELAGGLITKQEVWNDLAEYRSAGQ